MGWHHLGPRPRTSDRIEQAARDHETKMQKIEKDREALDKRSQIEEERWERQKDKLEAALRRASD
jgi:hypothetical protein